MTRSLPEIEADIAALDALLLPYGDFDTAEAEDPLLLGALAELYAERDHALNAEGAENKL